MIAGQLERGGLDLNEVQSIIRQAHSLGFQQICFTGGEPILRFRDILKAGELSHALGLSMAINSNGFFGSNKRKGSKILSLLCEVGLTKVTLSFDDSHAKYVSPEAVKNVIALCRDLGILIHLTCAFYALGNRVSHYFTDEELRGVVVSESPVQSSGRAQNQDDLCASKLLPQDLCPSPFQMVVNFDGNIFPCCSVSGFTKSIKLGNIRETSLAEAMQVVTRDKYLFYIQKRGLSEFFNSAPLLEPMTKRAHSVCDLCKIVSESDYFGRKVSRFIDDEFAKFAKITLDKIFA